MNTLSEVPFSAIKHDQRIADFDTIAAALDYAAQGENGICFYDSKGILQQALPYRDLHENAQNTARKLNGLGLKRGDRVAIIADTCAEFFALFYGCQYAGLIACPLPYTVYLGGKSAYVARIAGLLKAADAKLLFLPDTLDALKEEFSTTSSVSIFCFSELENMQRHGDVQALSADEQAYIQFSSGSTSEPKGIMISQRAISHNARAILRECIRITPEDRAFSWLPLYHDMGLVGFSIAPLFAQTTVDYITPTNFARRPLLWLQLMSQNQCSITYAPVFGYKLAASKFKREENQFNLSKIKIAGIGGDMIHADQLDMFSETLAPTGFKSQSFTPSYGMAESTLLVAYRHGIKTDQINKDALEKDQIAVPDINPATSLCLTVCGKSLQDHTLFVGDADGTPIAQRHIGHIYIKGPSLMSGYCNGGSCQNDFFDTGDMGYLYEDEIVITGRHKDMIAVNGRNIWPQDIENTVNRLEGLSNARIACFSAIEKDQETVIVLVESALTDPNARDELINRIKATVNASEGVSTKIQLIPLKTLEYTSSGKLSRSRARQFYLSNKTAIN